MPDPAEMFAFEMAEAVRNKRISPVEITQAHLRRIERLNPSLNAYIEVDAAGALEQAREREHAITSGKPLGPLHGVPISIKSSVSVKGLPWETGSRLRTGMRGKADAPLVARLRAAGAIILGVTNVPEMLMNYFTDNSLYGTTRSPFDLEYTPGGSSGGESAAISSCCSAAGIGSDGGGSIRVPAHFCGIFGLKPTPGRISISGHYPPSGGPFACLGVVGPMARSVKDVQTVFEITAGPDCLDPASAPVPVRRIAEEDLRGLRIGYFEDDGITNVTPETAAAVRSAAEILEQQGVQTVPFRLEGLADAQHVWWMYFCNCGSEVLRAEFAGREDQMSEGLSEFMKLAQTGEEMTRDSLLRAWFDRDRVRNHILSQMVDHPVLISPVCAIPAFRHGQRSWNIGGQTVDYLQTMSYSQWVNAMGFPAISCPAGRSPEGLPIGVQLIARPYEDELLLAVAAIIERRSGWIKPDLSWAKRSGRAVAD